MIAIWAEHSEGCNKGEQNIQYIDKSRTSWKV